MKSRKRGILSFTLVLVLFSITFSGCSDNAISSIAFSQLISQADKYNGKTVTLEAFYFSGFEISALSESVGTSSSSRRLVPTGDLVWVDGGIPQELYEKLYSQTATPSGYPERTGKLRVTGKFITGGKYGHLDSYKYQIKIASAEMLEWTPLTSSYYTPPAATKPTEGPVDKLSETAAAAAKVAEDFIRNSATFRFDGIEGSLALSKSEPGYTSAFISWVDTFKFETRHPGHGDRTGQVLAEVITAHYATVLVDLKNGRVMRATCDDTWDMLRDRELSVYIRGTVIGGGDTTPPGGPADIPRIFVFKVMREEGIPVNVSYTAYPPSPAGDAARAKITLDFYGGSVGIGDKIEACGILDKSSNTLVVAEQGDYIRTSLNKATVLGIVVSIREIAPPDIPKLGQYAYELLRDDGTFINVSYTAKEGIAVSLYNDSVRVGDYMKAVGLYDRSANTVITTGPDDMIKTYDHNPVRSKAVWE